MVIDFRAELGKLNINQIDSVYKDIKKQASILESLFGFPKFAFTDEINHKVTYQGRECEATVMIGFSRILNIQFELVQWIKGDCIQKKFLDNGNEGFFSISVYVEDLQSYLDACKKLGIKILQRGLIHRTDFAYLDTKKSLGLILELQEQLKRRVSKK
jgi:hypothetical protein